MMTKFRVTLWIEQDNLVVSFDHPYLHEWLEDDPDRTAEDLLFDVTDMNHGEAIGILEYMAQSDSWSGLFYDHNNVTRVKVERIEDV